jgi:Holliday junction resolvasome RuvABC endonuclease subunit
MNKDYKIYLGLDISTTTIGIAVVKHMDGTPNTECEVVLLEGLVLKNKELNKMKGIETLFLKNKIFREKLLNIKEIVKQTYQKDIDKIIIEEPLFSSNNIMTVGVLMKFNGIISNTVYEETGLIPKYISSYDSRCFAFPQLLEVHVFNKKNQRRDIKEVRKALKNGNLVLFGGYPFQIDKKTVIQELVGEKFPNIEWLYNKKGELDKSSFDSSDSLACVLGYINKTQHNDEKPIIVDISDNGKEIIYTTSFKNSNEKFIHKITF